MPGRTGGTVRADPAPAGPRHRLLRCRPAVRVSPASVRPDCEPPQFLVATPVQGSERCRGQFIVGLDHSDLGANRRGVAFQVLVFDAHIVGRRCDSQGETKPRWSPTPVALNLLALSHGRPGALGRPRRQVNRPASAPPRPSRPARLPDRVGPAGVTAPCQLCLLHLPAAALWSRTGNFQSSRRRTDPPTGPRRTDTREAWR